MLVYFVDIPGRLGYLVVDHGREVNLVGLLVHGGRVVYLVEVHGRVDSVNSVQNTTKLTTPFVTNEFQ